MATFLTVDAPDYRGDVAINFDSVVMVRPCNDDNYCTIHYDTKAISQFSDYIVIRKSYQDMLHLLQML